MKITSIFFTASATESYLRIFCCPGYTSPNSSACTNFFAIRYVKLAEYAYICKKKSMKKLVLLMVTVLSAMNVSLADCAISKSDLSVTSERETCIDNDLTDVDDSEDKILVAAEQMPEFVGGMSALMKWLGQNIVYPMEALKEGITGRVIMKFVIEKDGTISNPEILKGAHPLLDAEALRVISVMPKWNPAKKNGQPVRCYYTLPVSFVVDDIG